MTQRSSRARADRQHISWRYYIVYCCILAAMLVAQYFLFPETKGRTLEEIKEVFDGEALHTTQAANKGFGPDATMDEGKVTHEFAETA